MLASRSRARRTLPACWPPRSRARTGCRSGAAARAPRCPRTPDLGVAGLTVIRADTDSGVPQHGGMKDVTYAIETHGLVKRFGKTTALAGVDLTARTGSVLGLLGPNGAGKTTAVRILATLLPPDAGSASVCGY